MHNDDPIRLEWSRHHNVVAQQVIHVFVEMLVPTHLVRCPSYTGIAHTLMYSA